MNEGLRYDAATPFQLLYDGFFNIITEDMYYEMTIEETEADMKNILLSAIPNFGFPKFKIFDYDLETNQYNMTLSIDEVNIIVYLMIVEWINRQILTVDVTKQKYSSSDFNLTSQANHLAKLMNLQANFTSIAKNKQHLYGRRTVNDEGFVKANYSMFGGRKNAN
jgi:hypothetical protein